MKFPEPGRVKTRIAKDAGAEYAAEAYRRIASRVLLNTRPSAAEFGRIIFYTPESRERDFRAWLPGERLVAQEGRDVGERMSSAIRRLLSEGAPAAVIAGADIPELNAEIVRSAFSKLGSADIVLGPAVDGGYYLIGMKSPHDEVFQNISWSTGRVFRQTVLAIGKLKLRYDTVRTLSDVDTLADLKRFLREGS